MKLSKPHSIAYFVYKSNQFNHPCSYIKSHSLRFLLVYHPISRMPAWQFAYFALLPHWLNNKFSYHNPLNLDGMSKMHNNMTKWTPCSTKPYEEQESFYCIQMNSEQTNNQSPQRVGAMASTTKCCVHGQAPYKLPWGNFLSINRLFESQ